MDNKLSKKIISGLVAGCFVLSVGAVSLASSNQAATSHHGSAMMTHGAAMSPDMENNSTNCLAKLVSDGTITQEQADKVASFMKEKFNQHQADMELMKNMSDNERDAYMQQKFASHHDPVAELQEAAGLNAAQAKAVAKAMRPRHYGPDQKNLAKGIQQLVANNTISQAQADKITSFFQQKRTERQAEHEKLSTMTDSERQAYFQEHHKQRPDMVNDLTAAAGLSTEQAQAVAELFHPQHPGLNPEMITAKLQNLVSSNTITQEQSEKIAAFFQQKRTERQAEHEKLSAMTDSERQTYFQEHHRERPDLTKDLTAAAGLSTEQAQAVAEALRPEHGPGPCPASGDQSQQ